MIEPTWRRFIPRRKPWRWPVVRAFVRLRQGAGLHPDLAKRLEELGIKTERLELSHDTFSHNTRIQLQQMFDAIRELGWN
jgi:hypothetical protein